MSVLIETNMGDVVVDLFTDVCPVTTRNFLMLCQMKYFHGHLFFNVQENYIVQTGDPTGTGDGGESAYALLEDDSDERQRKRFFDDEIRASLKHNRPGLLSMASGGVSNANASQFFITLRGHDLEHLDGKQTIFGEVAEGMETLEKISSQFCDDDGRPYRDTRILHTHVLDNPFPSSERLERRIPPNSPTRTRPEEEKLIERLGADEELDPNANLDAEEVVLERARKEAKSRAVVLEMLGDLQNADDKAPENVLFVAKLNPVTSEEDLELIFSRFGPCKAYICQDHVTGDSLNFGFIEFQSEKQAVEAYLKANNYLIDDRRIKVDFSQSTSKQKWNTFLRLSSDKDSRKRSHDDDRYGRRNGSPDKRQRKER